MTLSHKQLYRAAKIADASPGGIFNVDRWDPVEERLYTHRIQDVEPILEDNKQAMAAAEAGRGGYTRDRSDQRVAQIPNVLLEKWYREEGIDWRTKEAWAMNGPIMAKLDDPNYLHLRTAPGRLSGRPVRVHPTTSSAMRKEPILVTGK